MKILMVGLGGIGQRHVRNLRQLLDREVQLIAYRWRNDAQVLTDQLQIQANVGLTEKYGIGVYRDFEQALEQKPDAVFICNPSSLHIPYALDAARRGIHLFIEKPLSHNLDGVDQLIEETERLGIRALVGYQMRFHPCLIRLEMLLRERLIGRVLSVRSSIGEYLPSWHVYEDYRQMYASRRELGGGVVLSQIHELDYIYWLFGMPTSVYAIGGHLSSLDIDVEDTVDILMEYQMDGQPTPVSVHLDYVQRPPSRTCEVIGDSGKIMIDLRALMVNVWDGNGNLVESSSYEGLERNQLFLDELRCFLRYLQGAPANLPSIREAAQSLRMALAAKESMQSGSVTRFPRHSK
jgi:predicted dehydrogenase